VNRPWIIGLVLGAVATLFLSLASTSVGYARDEGVYFEAGRHYAAWTSRALSEPGQAMKKKTRDRYFRINKEHPPLMKLAAGVSGRLLAEAPQGAAKASDDREFAEGGLIPVMREGGAMRLPAQVLAGFGVFLLFMAGRRFGGTVSAGVLAAGWFVLQPRVFFHAGLNAFDVPIAVATLAVVLAYRKSLASARWGIALGLVLGVAIAVKHNALFLGPLLALHYYATLGHARFRQGRSIQKAQLVPLPLVSMAVLGPLVAVALWPWLWGDPVARIGEYFAFHNEHAYYNMEFLGQNYNRPPLPISYPLLLTLATVPAISLLLAGIGLVLGVREDLRAGDTGDAEPGTFNVPLPDGWPQLNGFLLALLATFPLVLIALPWIPIFGGTKHWLTAYPFMALAAAFAWGRLWKPIALPARFRQLPALAVALVLLPGAWATIDGHPYGLSQYSALAGGPRGAADAGLNRGFWGYAAPAILDSASDVGSGGTVFLHDIHESARRQYVREGRWPEAWKPARINQARAAFLFHEKHFAVDEIGLWNRLGTTRPTLVITLDDVPLTSFYSR
jgi:hypothetical protein